AASDGGKPVEGTVGITVTDSNRPPSVVIAPAGTMKMVSEGHELRFTVSAIDPDADDTPMVAPLALPQGSSFAAGVFTWTPDGSAGSKAGTAYDAIFAADDGTVM